MLLVCLGLTAVAWRDLQRRVEGELRRRFEAFADSRVEVLRHNFDTHITALAGVRALFASSVEVTPSEFAEFAENIRAAPPGLEAQAPAAPAPAANYVPYVQAGNLLYISGQISQDRNGPAWLGHLGDTVSLEDGQKAAQACALAILSPVAAATGGELARVRRIVKLGVFVASAPGTPVSQ